MAAVGAGGGGGVAATGDAGVGGVAATATVVVVAAVVALAAAAAAALAAVAVAAGLARTVGADVAGGPEARGEGRRGGAEDSHGAGGTTSSSPRPRDRRSTPASWIPV
eukprot:COSAG03_NODE_3338_length_2071_cov_2.092292_3_plen_108_part_00